MVTQMALMPEVLKFLGSRFYPIQHYQPKLDSGLKNNKDSVVLSTGLMALLSHRLDFVTWTCDLEQMTLRFVPISLKWEQWWCIPPLHE